MKRPLIVNLVLLIILLCVENSYTQTIQFKDNFEPNYIAMAAGATNNGKLSFSGNSSANPGTTYKIMWVSNRDAELGAFASTFGTNCPTSNFWAMLDVSSNFVLYTNTINTTYPPFSSNTSNNWNIINNGSGSSGLYLDPFPYITSVSPPSNGNYSIGQQLDFTVNFSENVTITGSPYIQITMNTGGTVNASYVSGSGTSSIVFRYTIQSGNLDTDGITIGSSISLNGGSIRDVFPNNAVLTLNSVGSTASVLVDGIAPTISSVAVPSNGYYSAGSNLNFTVNFSENVTITGSPYIPITMNTGGTVYASYASGSGSSSIVFRYTIQSGNLDMDGITIGSSISLNGGTIKDVVTNNAALTLNSVGSTASVLIDGVAPVISNVSVPSSATYTLGQNLDFIVNFPEVVYVNTTGGTPVIPITLNTGGTVNANYVSGSGTTSLVFRYTIASGNIDQDGVAIGSMINLYGATIMDVAYNNAVLTLNSVGSTTSVLVDGVAPVVSSINRMGLSPNNSSTLEFLINFSEGVQGLDNSDVSIATTGSISYTTIASTTVSTSSYKFTLSGIVGNGTLGLNLKASATGITDLAGNAISGGYTGQTYTIDQVTLSPSITSPASGTVSTGILNLNYSIPETAFPGSKKIIITQNASIISSLDIADINTGALALNLKNLNTSLNQITSITGSTNLSDGAYTISFSYQDQLGNSAASTSVNIILDAVTIQPSLIGPISNSSFSGLIPVSLTLGESYSNGSAKLVFTNATGTYSNTLTLVDNVLSQSFTITTANINSVNIVSSSHSTIPDGNYSLRLEYRDVNLNPIAFTTITNLLLQTSTPIPTITSPSSGTVFGANSIPAISYNLPSAPLSGTAVLALSPGYNYTLSNLVGANTYTITSNIPVDGNYTCTVRYQDFLGNPLSTSAPVSLVFNSQTTQSTPTPKIISPIANASFSNYMLFFDSLPIANRAGSKILNFSKDNTIVSTIVLNDNISDSIYLNLQHLSEARAYVQSITGSDALVDGTYLVSLTYQDTYGNPASSASVTINIDTSPFIGVLSHQTNVVFGTFTETLTFNKPVNIIASNPIIPNLINNTASAQLGSLVANANKTIYTFQVIPLQQGIIKLQAPFVGVAYDVSGNRSQIIEIDSIEYIDTTIRVNPTIVGNLSFCVGDSTTLTSSAAKTYLWSTGATTKSIVVKQSGTYNVKVTYDNFVSGTSADVIVTANPIPARPVISRDINNNLVSTANYGNIWFESGTVLNDTSATFRPAKVGVYTVKSKQLGCTSPLSVEYYYLVTDILNLGNNEFIKFAPNPFVSQVKFDFNLNACPRLNLEIFDIASGYKVKSFQGLNPGISLNLSELSSGTYLFKLSSLDGKYNYQLKSVKL